MGIIQFLVIVVVSFVSQMCWAYSSSSRDGIYIVNEDSSATPQETITNDIKSENTGATPYFFLKEEVFAVHFAEEHIEVSLLLEEEELGEFPEKLFFSYEEFEKMNIEFGVEGTIEELQAAIAEDSDLLLQDISQSDRPSKKRARMHYKGARGCVAYVLSRIGWPGGRSGNGVEITRTLKRHLGYHTVSCKNPKPGTIASWSGGSGAGHTAIWNGKCWAYDIACGDPGKRYRLIECVAK